VKQVWEPEISYFEVAWGGLQDGGRGLAVTSPPTTWGAYGAWGGLQAGVSLGGLSPHPPLRGGLAEPAQPVPG